MKNSFLIVVGILASSVPFVVVRTPSYKKFYE